MAAPEACSTALAVIPETPAPQALRAALALAAAGRSFRIGGDAAPPIDGPIPLFETLSGGSGGTPKRICRSQASWTASFAVNARLFGIGPQRRVAVLGRLIHSLALYGALEALHLGAALALLGPQRPDRQRATLAAQQIDLLYATPAQLRLLIEAGGGDLPDLRLVLVGGSKLDPGLREAVRSLAPRAAIHEFYGAAETSFITLSDADTPEGSVGKAYPGVEIAPRDADGQPAQGQGLIWVRSPYLAQGYGRADPQGAIWQQGWVSVGEVGALRDGYLYLAGRRNRMVTVADQNVFPEEIESFLQALPGVSRAAVLPRPDALRGQVLQAVLMGDATQAPAILTALRQHFGPLKAPRSLQWRDSWPILASGKTDLAALAAGLT